MDWCMNCFSSLNSSNTLYRFLRYNIRRRLASVLCCSVGRHSGTHLTFIYVMVKLLYIANAIGQLFLLNVFMGRGFSLIWFEATKNWWNDRDVEIDTRFPRITMCKFRIRTLGDNIQPFDVQCLLPINIYNEKVENDWSSLKCNLKEVTMERSQTVPETWETVLKDLKRNNCSSPSIYCSF